MGSPTFGTTMLHAGTGGADSGLPPVLVRALGWLRANLHEPLRLEDMAQAAGARPRTLETLFRLYLGTTPLAWVRAARLGLARQRLLLAGPDDTVTAVALASGFGQLGRFAAYYRDRFGELPSQTLRRVQGAPQSGDEMRDDNAARLTWRAFSAAFAVAPKACSDALELLEAARDLAPDYALPKALAAWCYGQRVAHHFGPRDPQDRARSLSLAVEASEREPGDAMTQMLASSAMVLAHRLNDADRLCERALALDPWSPFAWIRRGWLSAYGGDSETAIRELRMVLYLMPFEPLRHLAFIGIGCAHFAADRYEQAARWAQAGVQACPGSFWAGRVVAAAATHAGAHAEARRAARQLLRQDRDLTVAEARTAWPFPPDFMARLADGLASAGVPKG
jgi:AraC-like DNA-binding protein